MQLVSGVSSCFRASVAAFSLATCLSTGSALAFGMPIYTTAPTDVTFTNIFGPDLRPTGTVSINASGVIRFQTGEGHLVGDPFTFSTIADLDGESAAPGGPSITFDGTDMIFFTERPFVTQTPGRLMMMFPVFFNVSSSFVNEFMIEEFNFAAPFEGYNGPDDDLVVELLATLSYTGVLPTKTFSVPGMSELFDYIEGTLVNARFQFSRIDGPPAPMVAAIPLPATLPLALGALGFLVAAGVRRRFI